MAHVALAWLWAKGCESVLVGCSKPSRVDDAVAALDTRLTADELAYLRRLCHLLGTKGILEVIGDKIQLIDQTGISEYRPNTAPDLLAEFLNGKNPLPIDEIFHVTETAIKARDAATTEKMSMGDLQ